MGRVEGKCLFLCGLEKVLVKIARYSVKIIANAHTL